MVCVTNIGEIALTGVEPVTLAPFRCTRHSTVIPVLFSPLQNEYFVFIPQGFSGSLFNIEPFTFSESVLCKDFGVWVHRELIMNDEMYIIFPLCRN